MKEIFERKINLQLFAEAGTVVNSLTNGFVNAYDGTTQPFTDTNSLAGELKTFYDTELLENARVEMFYAQFAKKQTLPAKHGGTIEWRKFNTFKKADRLIEGVIPEGQKGGTSTKTGFMDLCRWRYSTYSAQAHLVYLEGISRAECRSYIMCTPYIIKNQNDSRFRKFLILISRHSAKFYIQ